KVYLQEHTDEAKYLSHQQNHHPLPSRVSTIDPQIRSRHEAARIANAEHRRTPVLLRNTKLAQHVLRGPVALALGVLLEQRLDHGGRDVAGRDGVDADAVGAPFGGQVAAELEHGGFGGVVGGAD
ncbi:9586_t:CDS:1, partial [Scutellospora calospora]